MTTADPLPITYDNDQRRLAAIRASLTPEDDEVLERIFDGYFWRGFYVAGTFWLIVPVAAVALAMVLGGCERAPSTRTPPPVIADRDEDAWRPVDLFVWGDSTKEHVIFAIGDCTGEGCETDPDFVGPTDWR